MMIGAAWLLMSMIFSLEERVPFENMNVMMLKT